MKNNGEVLNRIPQLDGIRGLAVLLVVLDHASYWYSRPPQQMSMLPGTHGPMKALLTLTSFGWLGVDLFFILSGYLITSILLRTRNGNSYYRSFYARRVLRIFPVFWLLLITLAVIFPHSPAFLVLSLFFLSNVSAWFGVSSLYFPLWSLCVEEHFYFMWPFVVRKVSDRVLFRICVVVCVVEPLLRAAVAAKMGQAFLGWPWYFSGFRFEGLAYGAILALIAPKMTAAKKVRFGMAAMCAGVAILAAGIPFGVLHSAQSLRATVVHSSVGLTFASVFFFGLVCLALGLDHKWARLFANAPLVILGELSYCLYLVHQLVFWGWDHWLNQLRTGTFGSRPAEYFVIRLAACALISGVIALLSRRFVEAPILSLKRFFPPNRKTELLAGDLQTVTSPTGN